MADLPDVNSSGAEVPSPDAGPDSNRAEWRTALLDQLEYLVHEVEALKTLIDQVPDEVQGGRPTPDALTIKEIYGVMAVLDEEVHQPRLHTMLQAASEEMPAFETVDEEALIQGHDFNEQPIHDILDRVQDARRHLVETLQAADADAWMRAAVVDGETYTVYEVAHHITQEDTRRLRIVGHRLHETDLTRNRDDLPK